MLLSSSFYVGQFPGEFVPFRMVQIKQLRKGPLARATRAPAGAEKRLDVAGNAGNLQGMHRKELQAAIRKQLHGVKLSPSSYDTAWVAMVPLQGSPRVPYFPQCIEWILQNQQDNGSWCTNPTNSTVTKDILLSTLACVLALKRWNVGPDHIWRGLNFIARNFSVAMDVQTAEPVGFNVTFSGMLNLASEMGLGLPVRQTDVDGIFHLRKIEMESDTCGSVPAREAFMAYVSEGFGSLQDWEKVMTYQRKNGSLFNSPSATAAAAIHSFDDKALTYLDSLVSKFGGPVPMLYPQSLYNHLYMVDTLEKMGISQNFTCEIRHILDMAYQCWMHNEEEVMLDMTTCAMAFRLLRMHGYDITSDGLAQFSEQSNFDDSIYGYLNDTKTLLELYKTSQIRFSEDDLILENIGSWSTRLLKQQLSSTKISRAILPEVEHALKSPFHATMDRLEHRRNIEQFETKSSQLLKSRYCGSHSKEEILALAIDEFHSTQPVYQQELQDLESWVKQVRLDELEFARVMPLITHFSAAATMFPRELSDARMALGLNSLLVTAVDDFFDCGASREEMENYVALIEKWDKHSEIGFCSKNVEVLFYAVYNTNKEIGEKAALVQNRSVMDHIAELWLSSARAMMTEAEWAANKYTPATLEEYMATAEVSLSLGTLVPLAAYLVGPKLSEEAVKSEEYNQLLKHVSIIGRLLNDVRTYEKEIRAGKVNSVMLHALSHGGCSPAAIEAAKREMQRATQASRFELQRLVVREGGIVPRPCKEPFWDMCQIVSVFYKEEDGYFSPKEMMSSANAVIFDQLRLKGMP